MRGAQSGYICQSDSGRIIPADAGSTCVGLGLGLGGQDHPRGCGEHSLRSAISLVRLGSSPRMRGALNVNAVAESLERIIPADAGST